MEKEGREKVRELKRDRHSREEGIFQDGIK